MNILVTGRAGYRGSHTIIEHKKGCLQAFVTD